MMLEDKTLLVLAVLAISLGSLIVTPILTWILSRQKEKALEAIKAFAEQGRDPPPELLKVIADGTDWKAAWGVGDDGSGSGFGANRWSSPITLGGLALGFGIGALVTGEEITHPFWIVTIVCGAMGLATLVQALLSKPGK